MRLGWLLLGTTLLAGSAQAERVRVWQGTLTLPTYEEGEPDPNPPFDQYAVTKFSYPYTLRENLTSERRPHQWRAVFLENEYLKCSVLPDIGGHVYTCIDKLSGQPMFYANPSIKKANIGYRGAWAAFGIEFNFPVSHNWVSMSPVPYSAQTMPDGSASVTVGNVDRVYGMQWSTELRLQPGSTVLEERVTLYNRSDVRHRFYWWNNAAIEVKDDSRVVYPMRWSAAHGFADVDTWPVDSTGTDLSIIGNQKFGPVSRFVHGSREPFMGIWRPDTNTGTVHFADYASLPAKKIWSWGVDPDGLDWRKALSDNNSAYAEVQAGLFRNQETYAFLGPRQQIQFSEYWMPVRGIGGIARANLAGVLNMERRGDGLFLGFNSNQVVKDAHITVKDGDSVVLDVRTNIEPGTTWTHLVKPAGPGKLTFELSDLGDKLLMRHREGEYDWSAPSEIQTGLQKHEPVRTEGGEDDWLEIGRDQELNGKLLQAVATYQDAFTKYPQSFSLRKAAGRLAACLFRYDDAVRYLEPVQSRATSDPEIEYYLGLAYDGTGNTRQALASYEAAARLPAFRVAASLKLGELWAREADRANALRWLQNAGTDRRAQEELAALQGHPLAVPADAERLLDVAATYIRLGLYQRAAEALSVQQTPSPPDQSEPGALLPQDHPLVAYYRGYCREKMHAGGAADYARASELSTRYVFPNRADSKPVLVAAINANPHDNTARYLLGTWYFARGMTDDALAQWQSARSEARQIPVLHADIGRALLFIKHDFKGALEAFREGLPIDARNVALYQGMDQAMSLLRYPARERAEMLSKYPDGTAMPASLVYELALNRAEAGEFEAALALFHNRFFPREEGGTNVRQVWVEVRAQQALSLAKAGKCDAALEITRVIGDPVEGLSFTQDGLALFISSARTQLLIGQVEGACGRKTDRLIQVANAHGPSGLFWAQQAARELPGYDAGAWWARLEAALRLAVPDAEASATALYNAGLMNQALGHTVGARQQFERTLLLPDRNMSHHLARLALEH